MPTVNTVLGPVETADLGFAMSHEHVGTNTARRTPMDVHLPAGAAPPEGTGRLRPRHPPDHGGEPPSVL